MGNSDQPMARLIFQVRELIKTPIAEHRYLLSVPARPPCLPFPMDPEFAFVLVPIPSLISLCSFASCSHAFVIPLCSIILFHGQTGTYMVRAYGPCAGRIVYILQYLPCIFPSFDILVRLSTTARFLQHSQ
jgi:hypothetical protein